MSVWSSEDAYLRAEWDQAVAYPELGERMVAAVGGRPVEAVLDVGCGAGQELVPFVTTTGARGVGIDLRVPTLRTARRLLASAGCTDVQLLCGRAEALPMDGTRFDVAICRGVLVYTDVAATLAEIRRVLRPGGVAIIQVGTIRYELQALRRHLTARRPHHARATLRRIGAGTRYHLTGRQTPTREIFFTRRRLTRELARAGLHVTGAIDFGNPRALTLVAERQP